MIDTIKTSFSELFELTPMISIFTVLLLAVVLFIISHKTIFDTRILTYGALAIASSFVLSYIKVFQFPNGGSITIASMLPLFLFAYIAGPAAGMAAGICYGMLQFIQEPFIVHWVQFLLDYPLAFSMLGLAGLIRKNVYAGAVLGSFARLVLHFISGVVFFAEYVPAGENLFAYSLVYNISYIVPDMIICLVVLTIPAVRAAIIRVRQGVPRFI